MSGATSEPAYVPVPFAYHRLPDAEARARSQGFLDTIRQRHSVRLFSPDPVPYELIENAVAAAGTAPSGANQQPWTFAVIADPAIKARIRVAAEAEERDFYDHHISPEWRAALAPLGTDFQKAHLTDAPYLVIAFMQAYGLEQAADGTERQWKHYYASESIGIAVGLFLASITYAGLVALTHTPSPMAFLSEILGRPRNERAFVLLPVGYPAEGATVPAHALDKKPLNRILVRY